MEKSELIAVVRRAMLGCKYNNFAALGCPDEKIWVDAQGGFAAGDDPYFAFYKKDIGEDFFLLPSEVFERIYPGAGKKDSELTVMSICFPIDDKTRDLQAAGAGKEPCLRWMYGRNSWGPIIKDVSETVVAELAANGIRAAAVDLCQGFQWVVTEKYNLATNWSHRHAAFVAGLGTFGLCDGLISRWGKAVRYTTFILDAKIPADERPYEGYHDWCLFYAKGHCDACRKACPVGAITEKGHDKVKCRAFLGEMQKRVSDPGLDPKIEYGCGLCQGAVPCQKGVPAGLWKGAGQ